MRVARDVLLPRGEGKNVASWQSYEEVVWSRQSESGPPSIDAAALLLKAESEGALGWQYRALAFTFLGCHEEAIHAYEAAISEMRGAVGDGATTRERFAVMHFNLGAELCQSGQHAEALAMLSRAIELDVSCADTAQTDEGWSALWDDPRFTELVCCEEAPVAQRTPRVRPSALAS
jgi:tetratricopeptide (TPR) repeat protein